MCNRVQQVNMRGIQTNDSNVYLHDCATRSAADTLNTSFGSICSNDAYHIETIREMILNQFQATVREMNPILLSSYSREKYSKEIEHILQQTVGSHIPLVGWLVG